MIVVPGPRSWARDAHRMEALELVLYGPDGKRVAVIYAPTYDALMDRAAVVCDHLRLLQPPVLAPAERCA